MDGGGGGGAAGARIDTTAAAGRFVFGIFAALAGFEWELIRKRILASPGRHGPP